MPYANEYVPEADVRSERLDELFNEYNPLNPVPHPGFRHSWTVNREENSFLMRVRIGREEEGRIHRFVFKFRSVIYQVTLEYCSSGSTDQSPFLMTWRLQRIEPAPIDDHSRAAIVSALRSALEVFGYWGIKQQVPNTVVELIQ